MITKDDHPLELWEAEIYKAKTVDRQFIGCERYRAAVNRRVHFNGVRNKASNMYYSYRTKYEELIAKRDAARVTKRRNKFISCLNLIIPKYHQYRTEYDRAKISHSGMCDVVETFRHTERDIFYSFLAGMVPPTQPSWATYDDVKRCQVCYDAAVGTDTFRFIYEDMLFRCANGCEGLYCMPCLQKAYCDTKNKDVVGYLDDPYGYNKPNLNKCLFCKGPIVRPHSDISFAQNIGRLAASATEVAEYLNVVERFGVRRHWREVAHIKKQLENPNAVVDVPITLEHDSSDSEEIFHDALEAPVYRVVAAAQM